MAAYSFLILSLLLQGLTAVLALRLIPISGRRLPWIVISAALMVRFFREGLTLWLAVAQEYPLNLLEEVIAATVSSLLLVGVTAIKPIFQQLQGALTERQVLLERARQARRHADEDRLRLRTVINHLPVGLVIIAPDGSFSETNETFRKILGGATPMVGNTPDYRAFKGWWSASGEAIRPEEWPAARALWDGETSLDNMIDIERFDGRRATVLNSTVPILSLNDEITGVVVVVQDITDSKRLQDEREQLLRQASRQAAEREAIIHSLSTGVIIYAPDGEISHMNPAGERISTFFHGGKMAGAVPKGARVRRPDGRSLEAEEFPAKKALHGEVVDGEMLVLDEDRNGSTYLLLQAAPIRTDDEIVGAVASFTDITRLHELQEQNQTFVQMISHDLRTPLTVIQGHAELLLLTLAKSEAEIHVRTILAGAQMMTRMMEDLSDLARLEFSISKQPLDLAAFLPALVERMHFFLDTTRARLVLPAGLPPVPADPIGLERIMGNLLSNVLKYAPDSPVRVSARRAAGAVHISVADRGRGIAPEDLPRIFERYFRAGGTEKIKGTGLGLYISRLLAEAHGGGICALSRPGKGTVFFLTLPLGD